MRDQGTHLASGWAYEYLGTLSLVTGFRTLKEPVFKGEFYPIRTQQKEHFNLALLPFYLSDSKNSISVSNSPVSG